MTFLEWNKNGELIFEDACVKGSHVVDLVKSVIQTHINFSKLRGINELCVLLYKGNVPLTMISNIKLRERVESMNDTSKIVENPKVIVQNPGKWVTL